MSSTFFSLLSHKYQETLSKIFHLISSKKYYEAEKMVFEVLEKLLTKKYKEENDKEKDLEEKGRKNEVIAINDESDGSVYNYFIKNCLQPERMENLLWETGLYLLDKPNGENGQRAKNFLKEYKIFFSTKKIKH